MWQAGMSNSTDSKHTDAVKPSRGRTYILPVVLVLGLAVFFLSGAHEYVTWQAVADHYGALQGYANENLWRSYIIFTLAYGLVVAFSLPVALPMTLAGGAILGWPAVILVVIGATAGAGIVFIAAKSIFADILRTKAGPFLARLEAGFSENAFSYLLALRLIPAAPFWVVNIVPAFTRMRLMPFLLATCIGIAPGTAVFISVGRGFDHILASGTTPDLAVLTTAPILLPLVALGVLALLPIAYRRMMKNRKGTRP